MYLKLVCISFCIAFMMGCSETKSSSSKTPSNPPGNGGGNNPQPPTSSPLSLFVTTKMQGSNIEKVVGTCQIDSNNPTVTSKTCNMQIPELLMYYSDISFKISTDNRDRCTKVVFRPYWYLKSASANFIKDTDGSEDASEPINCSLKLDPACFGGAGPSMIDDFPRYSEIYFVTENSLSSTYVLESTYARAKTDYDRSMLTNVNAANNLPLASRSTSIDNNKVRYAGTSSSYQDYEVVCQDDWYNTKFLLKLILGDDDQIDIANDINFDEVWDWGQ